MPLVRLKVDVACEVDDLGVLVSAEDVRSLAILRTFNRFVKGALKCVAEDDDRFVVVDEADVEVGTVKLERIQRPPRPCMRGFIQS
jgi:hypothetical protein